jgi:DNA-binding transcriptional regulator YhcF (GntR family)
VALGELKTGDALPSIREVERQTGINRGKVHRAYIALRRSGLVSPAHGKGTAVAMATVAPDCINRKCMRLSKRTLSTICSMGVSPTAFARYLSRDAQGSERNDPFMAYVDPDREIALQRAGEISHLWQVSIVGMTIVELSKGFRRGTRLRKILANHLIHDKVASLARGKKVDIIPIQIVYTRQTIRDLGQISSNSSILAVLPPHALHSARFYVGQLRARMKSPGVEISSVSARDISSFEHLLSSSRYDRIIVTPGARGKVPPEIWQNPRILMLRMQFDPASLEAARIRAGVIL